MLASHGSYGFERMLLGSVSESVAMHAHCSVEVIRDTVNGRMVEESADNAVWSWECRPISALELNSPAGSRNEVGEVIEIGAAIGAATLVGFNTLQHKLKEKEENDKKSRFTCDHFALCSSLAAVGLALWEIKKHHHRHQLAL